MLLRSNFVLGVGFVLGGLLSNSCAHATVRVLTYNVEDPIFAIIGTYTNTVSEKRDSADVLTDLHVAVEIMGIPLFHEEATREEWWQHKRLVAFQGSTDDNGTRISLTGQAQGEHFVIHSSSYGALMAPAQVFPSNPWSPFLLKSGTMMSTKNGRLSAVVVEDKGYVTKTFDGRTMRLHQWSVDGRKHRVVWIDGSGVVVAFQTPENGHTITFVLSRETSEKG